MRVKLLQNWASPTWNAKAGLWIDVPEEVGQQLVTDGCAVAEKRRATEHAVTAPAETAAIAHSGRRQRRHRE